MPTLKSVIINEIKVNLDIILINFYRFHSSVSTWWQNIVQKPQIFINESIHIDIKGAFYSKVLVT